MLFNGKGWPSNYSKDATFPYLIGATTMANEQSFIIIIPFLNANNLWDVLENGTVYRIAAETFEQAAQFVIDDLLTDNMVIL